MNDRIRLFTGRNASAVIRRYANEMELAFFQRGRSYLAAMVIGNFSRISSEAAPTRIS
jgi:hypothetical protein